MIPHRAALLLATLAALAAAPSAVAAPSSTVTVRVEGASQTLFEGPVTSAGNPVKSASDSAQHPCDGTNNAQNPLPGATATGATVEGLRTEGADFDARWYPGFDDYYVTRLGPDAEDLGAQSFWGLLIDEAFSDVGGCQAQVHDGDRVLWAYDAFHQRGFLRLAATGDTAASPTPTAAARVGQPLSVTVTRAYGEKDPQYAPVGGVAVAPVSTAANGFETVDRASPATVTSSPSDGTATVVFDTPGWHRIKADAGAGGAIRSNRLDVCVTTAPGESCGSPPADTLPRQAAPLPPDPVAPPTADGGTPAAPGSGSGLPAAAKGAPVIELPHFTAAGRRRGEIGVSWRVLQAGSGIARWSFATRAAGLTKGAYAVRARGTSGTSALLRLPAGRTWAVRATFVDTLGRTVGQDIGTVLVPLDAGAGAVTRSGPWTRRADGAAWLGAVHVGREGARLTATLGAGRPVVQVRATTRSADVEIRAGAKRATYRIAGSATASTREIVGLARTRAGTVTVRVVRGQVGIDGVGTRP